MDAAMFFLLTVHNLSSCVLSRNRWTRRGRGNSRTLRTGCRSTSVSLEPSILLSGAGARPAPPAIGGRGACF